MRLLILLAGLICLFPACRPQPETLVEEGYDAQEMDAAIARARSEVDIFIKVLQAGSGTDFAVKAPIEDRGKVEHFWLTDVVYQDGQFEGLIGNDPGVVGNVKFGQKWKLGRAEISDWLYFKDGKMYGNYTMRPLLRSMSKDEAERFRAMLADQPAP